MGQRWRRPPAPWRSEVAPHPWMGVHRPGRTLQSPRPRTSCCHLGSSGICLGWAGALGGGASRQKPVVQGWLWERRLPAAPLAVTPLPVSGCPARAPLASLARVLTVLSA